MISKEIDVLYFYFRLVRDQFFPIRLPGIGDRRGHYAKIFGTLVRANVKKVAAVIDVVLVIWFARTDNCQFRSWRTGGKVAPLGRCLAFRTKQDYSLISRTEGGNIKEFVLLLKDQIRFITSQHVTEKLVRALGNVVFSCEAAGFVVGCPSHTSDALECFRQELSGA